MEKAQRVHAEGKLDRPEMPVKTAARQRFQLGAEGYMSPLAWPATTVTVYLAPTNEKITMAFC